MRGAGQWGTGHCSSCCWLEKPRWSAALPACLGAQHLLGDAWQPGAARECPAHLLTSEVMRVIGRRVDKLLGEVRGFGLGRENRLGRKLERGRCVEHRSRGHHGELDPWERTVPVRCGRLLRRNNHWGAADRRAPCWGLAPVDTECCLFPPAGAEAWGQGRGAPATRKRREICCS